jgi:hypothetical protein
MIGDALALLVAVFSVSAMAWNVSAALPQRNKGFSARWASIARANLRRAT